MDDDDHDVDDDDMDDDVDDDVNDDDGEDDTAAAVAAVRREQASGATRGERTCAKATLNCCRRAGSRDSSPALVNYG